MHARPRSCAHYRKKNSCRWARTRQKTSDARVIAATNYDLWSQVKKNKFREDLYYRLCGIEILMPPLRKRPEDIYPLTMHFLHKIAAEQKQIDPSFQMPKISQEAIKMLMSSTGREMSDNWNRRPGPL